jgi:hypothetical protein
VVGVFVQQFDFRLDNLELRRAEQALYRSHVGSESIPADGRVPVALRDASYALHRTIRKDARVAVTKDGGKVSLDEIAARKTSELADLIRKGIETIEEEIEYLMIRGQARLRLNLTLDRMRSDCDGILDIASDVDP